MALDLTKCNEGIAKFNEKYHVNFDLQRYINSVGKLFLLGDFSWDYTYRRTFVRLGKDMLAEKIKGNVKEDVTLVDMLNDFEKNIMRNYRHACKAAKETGYPTPYTGLDKEKAITVLQGIVQSMPKNTKEDAIQKYQKREMRIRDMVAFAKTLPTLTGEEKRRALLSVVAYSLALKEVNENRSDRWRFWHRWRNAAEQRESDNLLKMVEKEEPGFCSNIVNLEKVQKTFKAIAEEQKRLKINEAAKDETEYFLDIEENQPKKDNVIDNNLIKEQINVDVNNLNQHTQISQPTDTKQINAPVPEKK